jgi:nicotinamide mononucleotide adenylyltransferase
MVDFPSRLKDAFDLTSRSKRIAHVFKLRDANDRIKCAIFERETFSDTDDVRSVISNDIEVYYVRIVGGPKPAPTI